MLNTILNEPWTRDSVDDQIIGYWPEDGTKYEIACPPTLRDDIIIMQNRLCEN